MAPMHAMDIGSTRPASPPTSCGSPGITRRPAIWTRFRVPYPRSNVKIRHSSWHTKRKQKIVVDWHQSFVASSSGCQGWSTLLLGLERNDVVTTDLRWRIQRTDKL